VLYKRAASLVANRLYRNVATFKGGLPEWKKAGYPLVTSKALPNYKIMEIEGPQFKELLGKACILDIRTPKLYSKWNWKKKMGNEKIDSLSRDYLKHYFHKVPLDKLSDQYQKIPKDRMVVVVDYRGKQSLVAARYLKHNGYDKVCRLKGGLTAYTE